MKVKKIESSSNPTVKQIRKLHSRKERFQSGNYFLEGIRIVADALQQGVPLKSLIYSPDLLTSGFALELVRDCSDRVDQVLELSPEAFRSIAKKENPQGLAAVAAINYKTLEEITIESDAIWVVLDTIRDPGNLGTILRTLDGIGGSGVMLLDDCVDAFDPTAIRASMGGIFTQQVVRASFPDFVKWKKENHIHLVGTSDHEGRKHYREMNYVYPTFLMMGSERAGLPETHLELCDDMVQIPMYGSCDSLNLAVATGVVLYEIAHRLKGVGQ